MMKAMLKVIAMLLLCALTAGAANLVNYGGFETDSFSSFFTLVTNDCTFIRHVTWSEDDAHSGKNFVKLKGLFGDDNWVRQQINSSCEVVPQMQYEISAWIKRENFNSDYSVQLQIAWLDENKDYLSFNARTETGFSGTDEDYFRSAFTATAPADAAYGQLKIWIKKGSGPAADDVYVSLDDAAVEEYGDGSFGYNGGFEVPIAPFFDLVANDCTFLRHITWSPGGAHSGNYYIKLRGLYGDDNWLKQKPDSVSPVVPGVEYEVSAWIKRENFDPDYSVDLQVCWLDTNKTCLSSDICSESGFSGTEGYSRSAFTATAPADAAFAQLQIQMKKGSGPSGSDVYITIDDAAVEEVKTGNFVYNSGFETPVDSFFDLIVSGSSVITNVTGDASGAHNGNAYMELQGLFGDDNWLNQSAAVCCPVISGTVYEVTAWIKRQNFNSNYSVSIQAVWLNQYKGHLSHTTVTMDSLSGSDTEYIPVVFRAIAPAGSEFAKVKVWIKQNSGPTGPSTCVRIDDVAFEDYAYTRRDIEAVKDPACLAAGNALIAQIESADNTVIDIDPGYYRLSPGFTIDHRENLTLRQTSGSRGEVYFLFDTDAIEGSAINVNASSNIYLKDFIVDYYPPVTSQGAVVDWDESATNVVVEIDPGFPKTPTSWITSADFGKTDTPKAILFDQDTLLQKNMNNDMALAGTESVSDPYRYTISLGSGNMFGLDDWGYEALETGDLISFARRSHYTFLLNSAHVVVSNVTVYESADAMIRSDYAVYGGHEFANIRAVRKPGTRRLLVINNAGFHLSGSLVAPVITNCVITHTGDDGLDIHTHLSVVGDTPETAGWLSSNQIVVVQKFKERASGIVPGGVLSFYDEGDMTLRQKNIPILAAEEIVGVNSDYYEIPSEMDTLVKEFFVTRIKVWKVTLDVPSIASAGIQRLDLISPQTHVVSGMVVVDSVWHDINNNAIIVSAHNSRIERNVIDWTGGSGIVFFPYYWWLECNLANNVVINDNYIQDSMTRRQYTGQRRRGGIVVSALPGRALASVENEVVTRIFENIQVTSNVVVNCGYTPIIIKNIDNALVEYNCVDNPLNSPAVVLNTLDFSEGGLDEGFNCGIYFNNNDYCNAGGNSFSNMHGIANTYVGSDNADSQFQ